MKIIYVIVKHDKYKILKCYITIFTYRAISDIPLESHVSPRMVNFIPGIKGSKTSSGFIYNLVKEKKLLKDNAPKQLFYILCLFKCTETAFFYSKYSSIHLINLFSNSQI